MDLRTYLRALRHSWWIIVAATLIGIAGAVGFTVTTTTQYASTVTFFVGTPALSGGTPLQADEFAVRRVNSYVSLLRSDVVAMKILNAAGAKLVDASGNIPTVDALSNQITASSDVNTVLLTATVTDSSSSRSLVLATALADEFPRVVLSLDPAAAGKSAAVDLTVVSGPTLNTSPVSPKKTLNLILGLLLGLAVGLLLAIARKVLDTGVRSSDGLRALTQKPVLAVIDFDRAARKAPLILDAQAISTRAEGFRMLRTSLRFMNVGLPMQVISFASSVAGEGKSTTSTNLAILLAGAGEKVLLIEADLRRPQVADYLGLERAVGLTNVLAGQVNVMDVLQIWGKDNLHVLACGSIPPNPSELLGSREMATLIGQLRVEFDYVIIDTPPLLPVTDGAIVSSHSDGVVLVVREGKTNRSEVSAALRVLESANAPVVGTVLNMAPKTGPDRHSQYAGYASSNSEPRKSSSGYTRPEPIGSSTARSRPSDSDRESFDGGNG